MKRRSGFFIFAFILLLTMAGCGGDEGTSPPAAGHPGDGGGSQGIALSPPVQGRMAPTGGSITVPISGGAEADLLFPDGALRETVSFTITPEQLESGGRLRLRIEPGDVVLAKPVTVRLRLPSGEATDALAVYVGSLGNRLVLPTAVDAATGTVTAETHLFAPEAAVSATKPMMAGAGEGGAAEGGSGFINAAEMNCSNLLPELSAEIAQAKLFEFTSERAYQLTQKYKSTKAMCDSLGDATEQAELQLQAQEIQQEACDAQIVNLESISLFLVETEEQLYDKMTRLLGSQASLDLVSGPCSPSLTMSDGLTKAVSDYLVEYQKRIDSPNFGGGTWLGLRGEVKSIVKLYDDAGMLLLADHKQTVIDTLLKPALDKLHARAYQLCRQDNLAEGDQSYLADVMSGGQVFGIPIAFLAVDSYGKTLVPAGLDKDIQYCASDLTVQAYDGTDLLPDQTQELGGGDTPGAHVTQGAIEVPVAEGVLSLEGIIRPLRCATPTTVAAYDASTLVIKFNGVTVKELIHSEGDFLPVNPVDLDVSDDLYTAAGLDPNAPGAYVLEIFRQGTGCNGVYGEASVKLFDLTVVSAAPAVKVIRRAHSIDATLSISASPGTSGQPPVADYIKTIRNVFSDPLDPFESYSDSISETKTVNLVNTGSVDVTSGQSVSIIADSDGNLVSITGSGQTQGKVNVTCPSPCDVKPEQEYVRRADVTPHLNHSIVISVEGAPVNYTLSGSVSLSGRANGYFAIRKGSTQGPISIVEHRLCAVDDPIYCNDVGFIPAADLASSGTLQPGIYHDILITVEADPRSRYDAEFGADGAVNASGSFNFTLTFSPAP